MTQQEGDRPEDPQSAAVSGSFKFFGDVLRSIPEGARILWGVVVLLFLILGVVILFGGLSDTGQLVIALVIAVLVVVTFLVANSRTRPPPPPEADQLQHQAERCSGLLVVIRDANRRVASRPGEPWDRLRTDTYNRVCSACNETRLAADQRSGYLAAVCGDQDVKTVCDEKWRLGQALEDYRNLLARHPAPPEEHRELERLIFRSVAQPDSTPDELARAVDQAIEAARRVTHPG